MSRPTGMENIVRGRQLEIKLENYVLVRPCRPL